MGYDRPKMAGSALLNDPAAASVDTTTITGKLIIGKMNPIALEHIKKIEKTPYTAEVAQVVSVTIPTVAAATKYGIIVMADEAKENHTIGDVNVKARVESLSGSADTDKINIGTKWARHINGEKNNHALAGVRITITHASGAFTVGEYVTGVTSGARGLVRTGGSSTTAVVDVVSGVFLGSENIYQATTGITRLASSISAYTGKLFITDDPGYYPLNGTRKGPLTVKAGINVVTVTVETAGVVGFGAGADVVKRIPVLNQNDNNLASGSLEFPTNEAPVSTNNYSMYTITTLEPVDNTSISSVGGMIPKRYEVWYNSGGASVAAFESALESLV